MTAAKIISISTSIIYWIGCAILIYALMTLVHGFQAKDIQVKKQGFIALAIAVVMVGLHPLLGLLGVF